MLTPTHPTIRRIAGYARNYLLDDGLHLDGTDSAIDISDVVYEFVQYNAGPFATALIAGLVEDGYDEDEIALLVTEVFL